MEYVIMVGSTGGNIDSYYYYVCETKGLGNYSTENEADEECARRNEMLEDAYDAAFDSVDKQLN